MSDSERVQRALRAWHDSGVPVDEPETLAEREAKVLGSLKRSIREVAPRKARTRNRRRALGMLLAAAAVFGAVILFLRFKTSPPPVAAEPVSRLRADTGSALLIRDGSTRFAEQGSDTPLLANDQVSVATGGHAEVTLPSAANVELFASTRIGLPSMSGDEVVSLVMGSVSVSVPKLPAPKTLSVVTPDARVVVHGTRFVVSVENGKAPGTTVTAVSVSEGEVAVVFPTGHVLLGPGQTWRSAPEPSSSAQPVPEPVVPAPASAASTQPAPSTTSVVASAPIGSRIPVSKTTDALAEQNRLYRAGLAAKSRGDDARAVQLFSELLDRYPSSPLSSEAQQERDRARSRLSTSGTH